MNDFSELKIFRDWIKTKMDDDERQTFWFFFFYWISHLLSLILVLVVHQVLVCVIYIYSKSISANTFVIVSKRSNIGFSFIYA